MHIAGLGWNGVIGYSPIAMMRKQITTGLYQDNFALDFFANGVKKVPIISHPDKLSTDAKRNLKESFREAWEKGIVVLEEGMKIDPITMNIIRCTVFRKQKIFSRRNMPSVPCTSSSYRRFKQEYK
ncbi:phage portal protein [Brachyspira hyodysenteriae]|uniref:phage portal protein n=1 Tax=Brachyspira hyodysenteriae TaxID=159 RepID=UPI0022CD8584|nr:phage portal protein [Brachyspira hyodysenteriae]MCZ9943190.1 phage portal protein [Brachyspira hyodysenteriae]